MFSRIMFSAHREMYFERCEGQQILSISSRRLSRVKSLKQLCINVETHNLHQKKLILLLLSICFLVTNLLEKGTKVYIFKKLFCNVKPDSTVRRTMQMPRGEKRSVGFFVTMILEKNIFLFYHIFARYLSINIEKK